MNGVRKFLEWSSPAKVSLFVMMLALVCMSIPKSSSGEVCRGRELGYFTDIRVWLDGEEDVYSCEDDVVFYVRAARDCYTTVYVIDTEGFVHVIYPVNHWDDAFIRGGVVYRFSPPREDIFYSSYPKGIAFIFAVASPVPFAYSEFGAGIFAGGFAYRIYGDPFIACKRFYLSLLPGWTPLARVSVSFSRFYIRKWEPYPRYLCRQRYVYGFNTFDEDFSPIYRMYRRHHNSPYRVLRPETPLPVRSKDYSKIVRVKSRTLRKFSHGERTHSQYKSSESREKIIRKSSKHVVKREFNAFKKERSNWKKGTRKITGSHKGVTERKHVSKKMTSRSPGYKKGNLKKKSVLKTNPRRRGKSSSRTAKKL